MMRCALTYTGGTEFAPFPALLRLLLSFVNSSCAIDLASPVMLCQRLVKCLGNITGAVPERRYSFILNTFPNPTDTMAVPDSFLSSFLGSDDELISRSGKEGTITIARDNARQINGDIITNHTTYNFKLQESVNFNKRLHEKVIE